MMRNFVEIVFLSVIALAFAGSLSADDYHESGMTIKYDYDRDGMITRAEYDKGFEKKMKNKLEWLDTNNDGVISPEEFRRQHQIEFDHRWSMWDTDGDGVVSVETVLKHKQELRANQKEPAKGRD